MNILQKIGLALTLGTAAFIVLLILVLVFGPVFYLIGVALKALLIDLPIVFWGGVIVFLCCIGIALFIVFVD